MEGQKLLLFELQSNFCQPFVQIFGVELRKATRLFLGYLRDISRVSCGGMLSSLLLIRLTWCWCNGSRDRVFASHSRHYCSSIANDYFWWNIRDSNVMWYGRGYIVRFGARRHRPGGPETPGFSVKCCCKRFLCWRSACIRITSQARASDSAPSVMQQR